MSAPTAFLPFTAVNSDIAANTVVVMDKSPSMTEIFLGLDGRYVPKIEGGAIAFDCLRKHKLRYAPRDQIGMVVFAKTASVLFRLTHPANPRIDERLRNIRLHDMTNIAAGLRAGIDLLVGRPPNFLRNILLLSDGQPNVEVGGIEPAIRRARAERIKINTVGLGMSTSDFDEVLLRHIADVTGGGYAHARDVLSLREAFIRLG